jgi:hypothetical protein
MHDLTEIPFFTELKDSQRILIAGAGGGFDIYSGLPLYFALKQAGKEVFLANLSFTYLKSTTSEEVFEGCRLVKAGDRITNGINYFPEKYLANWFQSEKNESVSIYAFELAGVLAIRHIYEQIVTQNQIDTIILADGGTDSLMTGDEEELGTPLEDSCSLVAISQLSVKKKLLACLGFGVDKFHGVSHYRFLENTAKIVEDGGFLGSFHLMSTMPEVQAYISAVEYVNQRMDKQSIVSNSIVSALEGKYGNYHRTSHTLGSQLWINPLMSMYWCYHIENVVKNLKYRSLIANTVTRGQLNMAIYNYRQSLTTIRETKPIPV